MKAQKQKLNNSKNKLKTKQTIIKNKKTIENDNKNIYIKKGKKQQRERATMLLYKKRNKITK